MTQPSEQPRLPMDERGQYLAIGDSLLGHGMVTSLTWPLGICQPCGRIVHIETGEGHMEHRAAAPDPVASRQRWDYDEPHPFESKDMGNPTYDFCICERPRTDVMHLSDPVASPAPLDFEEMRREMQWPTPISMRHAADGLDSLAIPKYGDVLRWMADACDAALEGQPVAEEPRPDQEATP